MDYYLLVSLCLAAVSSLFSLTRQLQMLQQNSYYPTRYFVWLKDNLPFLHAVLFLISSVLFILHLRVAQVIFSLVVLGIRIPRALNHQKESIKKLVFTARVKRLFGSAIVIQLILITTYTITPLTLAGTLCLDISFMLSFLTPLMTLLIWAITLPIEKAVNLWFINDAKKILRSYKDLKVIGITGSYGKTTTKFILTRILSEKFNVACTPQSFNTPMGVVRTVRQHLKPQTQVFVCEMGAKNVGDIKEICNIVHPDLGLITSVGEQHLETFKSVDNVFKTKFELAEAVGKKNGITFVNGDSKEIKSRIDSKNYKIYGSLKNHDYTVSNITCDRNGSKFDISLGKTVLSLTTKLLGKHSALNIAGAVAVAYHLGVSPEDIKFAVASLKPTEHRLEMKTSINRSLLIDDAYNANPEGSLEAINVLGTFQGMKKVIITPGLIELGAREYQCNFDLGVACANTCDEIILVGLTRSKPLSDGIKSAKFNEDNLHIVSNFKEAMSVYSKIADSNTVVLLENDLPDNYLK
ncbi:MAG: UDP-N-acetylmuramoyl-tripeptide--D-alanyl-D-alanine ligase [Clostridia bacterium]|nr:UDP-N-acetylmuramoyl-tripeptide--D-alanyl-D-alanine ligase [Clostridia bacterium]